MKKLICLFAVSFGVVAGMNAQKNSVLLYGDLGLYTTKSSADYVTKSFNLNVGAGYQFDNNWTIGLTGGYTTFRDRPDGQNHWDLNDQYRLAPFLRYSRPLGNLFTFYTQGEFGYVGTAAGQTNQNTRVNENGVYAYVYPGIGINMGKGWALNFNIGGLGYQSIKLETVNNPDRSFGLSFGQHMNAGLTWNIPCQSKDKNFKKHHNKERDNEDGYDSWKRDRKNK